MWRWVNDIGTLYQLNGARLKAWDDALPLAQQSLAFGECHDELKSHLGQMQDRCEASLQEPDPLQSYGIEAQHPDAFVMDLLDRDHRKVCEAARSQRRSLKNPPQTIGEYLLNLEHQQLSQTRSRLQIYVDLL